MANLTFNRRLLNAFMKGFCLYPIFKQETAIKKRYVSNDLDYLKYEIRQSFNKLINEIKDNK
jgi:hypothetical protein